MEMLNQVGKKLDKPAMKVNMDLYFAKLSELAQTHPVKRIRFLVLNMVELRKANWVTRQDLKQTQEEGAPSTRHCTKVIAWWFPKGNHVGR